MPSPRKRIGFLPRVDIQRIIDEISKDSKLSQSKVTGILVEEALSSRGLLTNADNSFNRKVNDNINKSLIINKGSFNNINWDNEELDSGKNSINEDLEMINDFIEYKFFKKIMSANKNRL